MIRDSQLISDLYIASGQAQTIPVKTVVNAASLKQCSRLQHSPGTVEMVGNLGVFQPWYSNRKLVLHRSTTAEVKVV